MCRSHWRSRRPALGFLALLALLGHPEPASAGVIPDWATTLKSGATYLWGSMIAVGSADEIYVAGSNPYVTIVIARLDPAGNVLWQTEFDNPGTREQGSWMTLDPAGDVVVSGYNVAGGSYTPSGFVTLKLDSAGNVLWSDVIPYTFGATVRVATDAAGNIFVLGVAFLPNPSGNTTMDMLTLKYAPDGTLLWTRAAGVSATSKDAAGGLAVDAAGNVYVTGGTIGTVLTEAYDPNGGLLWSQQVSSSGAGTDVALGTAGEVYVTSAGAGQMLLAAFDASGNPLWVNGYAGIAGTRLAVDSVGDVIVTGYTGTGGYTDWMTHKVAPDGTLRWSAVYDRHKYNDEFPYGITIGPDDEIYITGQGGPGPTSGNLSYLKCVTVRYSPGGVEDWFAADPLSLRGLGVVRLRDNSIASVGQSTFTVFHYLQSGVFSTLGGGLAGSAGMPRLQGTGTLQGGTPVTLDLDQALPGANAWLFAGLSRMDLPFRGGVLIPAPDALVRVRVSGAGNLSLTGTWPAGLPAAFPLWFQFWVIDPAGPRGFAASNGLLATSL